MRVSLLLLLLAVAPFAEAQQKFDAVVAGHDIAGGCFIVPFSHDLVQWYQPNAVYAREVVTIGSADGRRVLALMYGNPLTIVEIRPDGTQVPFYTGLQPGGVGMAVAANGTVFVSVSGMTPELVRISPAGALEASYPFPGSNHLAVAPDGCTVLYSSGPSLIRRINGCTGAALPDFAAVDFINDIEMLPDGQVLVASESFVRLYTAAGVLVRTVASLAAYGLDEHTTDAVAVRGGVLVIAAVHFCTAAESALLRVDFSDGTELAREGLQLTTARGLVLGASVPGVPTLGEMTLALLAFALAAAGALALSLR